MPFSDFADHVFIKSKALGYAACFKLDKTPFQVYETKKRFT